MKARIFLAIAALSVLLSGCGTTANVSPQQVARYVNSITTHDMVIDIISIQPMKGSITYPGSACFITIKDGTIDGRLPFIGDAYNNLFSGEDVSYVFDKCPIEIKDNFTKAEKGRYSYSFDAMSGKDKVSFSITFTKTGRADLTLKCTSRSLMSYTGQIR